MTPGPGEETMVPERKPLPNIEAKVATHEQAISGLERVVGKLATSMEEMGRVLQAGFDRLRDEHQEDNKTLYGMIAKRDRPNWAVWCAALGLALTVAGGIVSFVVVLAGAIWSLGIAPMQAQMSDLSRSQRIAESMPAKFAEVETQMTRLEDLAYYRHFYQMQIERYVEDGTFPEPFPHIYGPERMRPN